VPNDDDDDDDDETRNASWAGCVTHMEDETSIGLKNFIRKTE
jgi:hypothetical protein